ncbi:MAG: anaerobic ribonucleoside-triphosphate reductase activating protein [Lachnospiraceae bacterium]
MNYASIKKTDIANGVGVRVSLFVSGCTHHCKECFNPETWNFAYGEPFTEETEEELLQALAPTHIKGLTLLGGEPMEPDHQRALLPFLRKVKERFPNKTIWCYTGYTLECDLMGTSADAMGRVGRAKCEVTEEFLNMLDILVDGEFMIDLKDIRLKFRGSSNQRILDVKKTMREKKAILAAEFM